MYTTGPIDYGLPVIVVPVAAIVQVCHMRQPTIPALASGRPTPTIPHNATLVVPTRAKRLHRRYYSAAAGPIEGPIPYRLTRSASISQRGSPLARARSYVMEIKE